MNFFKAVILLWTGIIAFHASVTALVINDMDVSAITMNSCGGLIKAIDLYFVDIRCPYNEALFKFAFEDPNATVGPPRHIKITLDRSPCDEEMQQKLKKINLPVKF